VRDSPDFPWHARGAVEWVASVLLETRAPGLRHYFLGRNGGQSGGVYGSLNMAPGRGDDAANVAANRGLVVKALDLEQEPLSLRQVHGDRIITVGPGDSSRLLTAPPEADAYITAQRGVPLMVLTADCLPVFIFDARTPALGVVHAGWRGLVLSLPWKAVITMMDEFGTRPEDCIAVVGPGIARECYEVGEEVRDAFDRSFPYSSALFSPAREGRWKVDLGEACRLQLRDALLGPDSIAVCPYCTHCGSGKFFSARRDGIDSGRQAAVAVLS